MTSIEIMERVLRTQHQIQWLMLAWLTLLSLGVIVALTMGGGHGW